MCVRGRRGAHIFFVANIACVTPHRTLEMGRFLFSNQQFLRVVDCVIKFSFSIWILWHSDCTMAPVHYVYVFHNRPDRSILNIRKIWRFFRMFVTRKKTGTNPAIPSLSHVISVLRGKNAIRHEWNRGKKITTKGEKSKTEKVKFCSYFDVFVFFVNQREEREGKKCSLFNKCIFSFHIS